MRFLLIALLLLSIGCRRPAPVASDPQPSDPAERLRSQISQGAFDLTAASESLAEAKTAATELEAKMPAKGDSKEDFLDLVQYLDSCGATVSDHLDEPPLLEEFRTQIPAQQKRLQAMIKAATDSLQELSEAQGLVESLLESPPKGLKAGLEALSDAMDSAADDLATAITDMGGKVPEPPDDESDEG